MRDQFDLIFARSRQQPNPDWTHRAQHLRQLQALVQDHRHRFAAAIADDFGQRPQAETDMAELFPTLQGIRHALRHAKRWMEPRRVATPLLFRPAKSWIQPRPLGVVGIISPWNYPLFLTVGPLTAAFAAGNGAMIKLSEHAPAFAQTFAELAAQSFDPDVLAAVQGDAQTAKDFAALPFDHLLFTGSTAVGRQIMAAAAANLTPVTLELGGKSPALIAPDARLEHAVARIMTGKLLNAGQTCIAPDYVLVPSDLQPRFIQLARDWVSRHYREINRTADYSRIINPAHYARLNNWLTTAADMGSQIHQLTDAEPDAQRRIFPPVIISDVKGPLADQEIFGPILPVLGYDSLSEAVAHITARPRPLAFYPFTDDPQTQSMLLTQVLAGGVTVNDTLMHVAQANLPFGGVGASGMGAYHGQAGFERLSHLMPVFRQSKRNMAGLLAPPYGRRFRALMGWMLRF